MAAGAALAPAGVTAQQAQPLVKSEVVRLLVTDTYGALERQQIVRRSCLTFTPTSSDLEDFRRLGATQELLQIIRTCSDEPATGQGATRDTPRAVDASGPAAATGPASATGEPDGQLPPAPDEVAVSAPAILEPADTGGVLSLPSFDTTLTPYNARPSPPPPQENILSRVEVPPRLRNPAEVQRMLRDALPESDRAEGGTSCVVWVYVGPSGSVRQVRLETSSGADAFDRAALEVARSMQFSPGTAGNRPVGMWVQQTLSLRSDS